MCSPTSSNGSASRASRKTRRQAGATPPKQQNRAEKAGPCEEPAFSVAPRPVRSVWHPIMSRRPVSDFLGRHLCGNHFPHPRQPREKPALRLGLPARRRPCRKALLRDNAISFWNIRISNSGGACPRPNISRMAHILRKNGICSWSDASAEKQSGKKLRRSQARNRFLSRRPHAFQPRLLSLGHILPAPRDK